MRLRYIDCVCLCQWRRHGVDWGGLTPLLLEVAPEIDTNPTSLYKGRGRVGGSLRLQTLVIGSRSALAISVHTTYFDLATPLVYHKSAFCRNG